MKITGSEPVSPFFEANEPGYGDSIVIYDVTGGKQILPFNSGLTIRQQFAMAAMASLAGNSSFHTQVGARDAADMAVDFADELIARLNKEAQP